MKTYAWYRGDAALGERLEEELSFLDIHLTFLDFLLPSVVESGVSLEKCVSFVPLAPYTRSVEVEAQEKMKKRKDLLRSIKRVLVPSRYSHLQVSDWLRREDIEVLPYCVVQDSCIDRVQARRVTEQIMWVGRWVDKKRWSLVPEICKHIPKVQMVMTSRMNTMGSEEAEIEKFRMMKASKVGFMPSLEEGLSCVPGEFLLCGAFPVIADIPANREGYPYLPMFPPNNLQKALELTLRAMSGEFDEKIPEWQGRVREDYSLDSQVKRFTDYFRGME